MGHTRQMRLLVVAATVLSAAGVVTPARAQDPDDSKRGVARLSLINGDISVQRGDSGEWVAGVINAPLLTGDHVATGPNSRGELEFDASNVVRLGANAELNLTQLEYGRIQVALARGIMTFRMLRNTDVNVEVDTPSVSVRPSRQGSFRISVGDDGQTEITARGGDVEVFTPKGSQWVRSGQSMMARGPASDPEFQIVSAGGPDDWDRWNDSRDHTLMQANSNRYVPQGVYGAEDLDNNGNWVNTPDYGNVWQPSVAPDWSPYYNGRWAWEDWYGWTWVSYDPWGWAPYHYGRWFHHDRYGWCWYPGAFGVHHYWSPALVGWFGFGAGNFGFGFGFGNVGWVPLAPYEVFHPWWGRGFYGRPGYFNRNVNVTNINVTNVYRNANVRNGVVSVGARDFQNGRFTGMSRVSGSSIREAGAIHGAMPFTPTSQSMRFSERQATVTPRATQTNFFTHQQPTPIARMPLGNRAQSAPSMTMPQNGVRGNQGTEGSTFRRFGSTAPAAAPQATAPRTVERNGFGGTAQSPAMRNDRPSPAPQGNYQRFGSTGNAGQSAPRQDYRSSPGSSRPQYSAPPSSNYNRQEPLRISPPVVRERPSSPSYSPPPRQSAPSYSAPHQSAPSYSAPHSSGGGGGGHSSSGGGGGGHSSGGGHGGGRR